MSYKAAVILTNVRIQSVIGQCGPLWIPDQVRDDEVFYANTPLAFIARA